MAKRIPKRTPKALRSRIVLARPYPKIRVKFKDNIRGRSYSAGHAAWFRYITKHKSGFYKRVSKHISSRDKITELKHKFQQIILDKVYNVYKYDQRTYSLFRSVSAARHSTGSRISGFVFYMDNSTAPAKVGDQAGKNYAIFFLYPSELNTFIPPRVKSTPKTFRDFYGIENEEGTVLEFMKEHSPRAALNGFINALKETRPRQTVQ